MPSFVDAPKTAICFPLLKWPDERNYFFHYISSLTAFPPRKGKLEGDSPESEAAGRRGKCLRSLSGSHPHRGRSPACSLAHQSRSPKRKGQLGV